MSPAGTYRDWVEHYPNQPADRVAQARAAIEAFEAAERDPAADLGPLVVAASSPHKLVCETGGTLLALLAVNHPGAQLAFRRLATARAATARFHAVAFLTTDLPEPLRREVLGRALDDRSAKVRWKAVEQAEEFGFRDLLPRLEAMAETDQDAGVRRTLGLPIPLLRDGYVLQPSPDGRGYHLTVRGPHGIGGPFIPNDLLTDEFVREQIAVYRVRGF